MQFGGIIHCEKSLAVEISDKTRAGISWENKMSRMHWAAPPLLPAGSTSGWEQRVARPYL